MPIFMSGGDCHGIISEKYIVTKDIDMLAPPWLAEYTRRRSGTIRYTNRDGHAEVKGVRIGDELAQIGDTVVYDGKRLSIERR